MKRLTEQQKRYGVFKALSRSNLMITAAEIGRKLGFKNGVPVTDTLCKMHDAGEVAFIRDRLRTGTEIFLWRLTDAGRTAAWREYEIPFMYGSDEPTSSENA